LKSTKGNRPALKDVLGAIIAFPGEIFRFERQAFAGRPG
jgi:hypothetical protein